VIKSKKSRKLQRSKPKNLSRMKIGIISLSSAPFNSVSSAGAGADFNASQGTDWSQRIGRRVKVTKLSITGALHGGQSNLATDDSLNVVRISVVVGVQGTAYSTYTVSSQLRPELQEGLVRVLYDNRFPLPVSARDSVGYIPSLRYLNIDVTVDHTVLFNGTGAGDVSSTTVTLLMISDSLLPTNPGFVSGNYTWYFHEV